MTHRTPRTSSASSSTGSPVRRLVLGAAAALGLQDRTTALAAALPATAPRPDLADGELTAQLARLHDDSVEQANAAVAEGREDLLQELSDSYVERAMALMAGAGIPPVRAAHQLTA